MEYTSRKRKSEGASTPGQPTPKKPNHHFSSPPKPVVNHGLPPLPEISEENQKLVFTHPGQAPSDPQASYDRFEFLGDAYLELYATLLIFERFPQHGVGKLSQIRETLVKNETIGQYATLYGLDKQLKNYKQYQNNSPHVWLKIKGDIFESYVAAVILSSPDGGDIAKRWLHQLWEPKLQTAAISNPNPSKKSKESLAKRILMKGTKINYIDEKAPVIHYGQGKEEYFVGAYFQGWGWENQFLGSGKGPSRLEAGQLAAADALRNPLLSQIEAKKAEVLAERDRNQEAAEAKGLEKDFIPLEEK